jgi:hypothetical protein
MATFNCNIAYKRAFSITQRAVWRASRITVEHAGLNETERLTVE